MKGRILLEVCCGGAEDVVTAAESGADRVELNSCLSLGGLTPSVGELIVCRRKTDIPIMVMLRPRRGGFCYSETEFAAVMADAEQQLLHGADGLVFGFLKADGTPDTERCRQLIALTGKKQKVFHRAIDVTGDWKRALEQLIGLGVDRVLTSGQAPTAEEGMEVIRRMREFAKGSIEILPGAGIRLENAERILAVTGCDQIHIGHPLLREDRSALGNPAVHFNASVCPPEECFEAADSEYIARMRRLL